MTTSENDNIVKWQHIITIIMARMAMHTNCNSVLPSRAERQQMTEKKHSMAVQKVCLLVKQKCAETFLELKVKAYFYHIRNNVKLQPYS